MSFPWNMEKRKKQNSVRFLVFTSKKKIRKGNKGEKKEPPNKQKMEWWGYVIVTLYALAILGLLAASVGLAVSIQSSSATAANASLELTHILKTVKEDMAEARRELHLLYEHIVA